MMLVRPLWIVAFVFIAILAGCSSPEEKAQSFSEKGDELLKQGKFVEAKLEFRNALQLNEDLAPAWLGFAKVEQEQRNWKQALGALKRVTELDPKNVDAYQDIARIMLFGGQFDEAIKYNNTAFELAPEQIDVLTVRSAILLRLGDTQAALEHARNVLEKDPKNSEALMILAAERLNSGDPQGALGFIERGLEPSPNDVGSLIFKIRVLDELKDNQAIKDVLVQLVDAYPETKAFRQALVRYHLSQNDIDAAEKEIRAIAAQFADDEAAQLDTVRFLQAHKGFGAAKAELVNLVEKSAEPARYEMALARLEYENGNSEAAEALLRDGIEKWKGTDRALEGKVTLAQIMINSDRVNEGKQLIAEILEQDKNHVDALSVRGQIAITEGEFDAAVSDFRTALGQEGRSPALKILLGRALELNGLSDLAEENYSVAMRESNFQPEISLEYVRFLLRQQLSSRAEEVIADLASRNRVNNDLLSELARIKLRNGDWEEAQRIAETLKSNEQYSGLAADIAGIALSGQQRFDESIEVLSTAVSVDPDNTRTLSNLVGAYMRAGRAADAEEFLAGVITASPENVQAKVLMARVKAADPERQLEAEADLQKAIETAPDGAIAYRGLAAYYQDQGDIDKAEEAVRAGLQALPDDLGLGLMLAGFLEQKGEVEDAIALYERMYEIEPQSMVIANNLASLLSDHRTDEESLNRAFELANRLRNSEIPFFKDTVAWVYFRRGDTEAALELLEEAVIELPNHPMVRYHLVKAYLKNGQNERAKQEIEKLLEQDQAGQFPFRAELDKDLATIGQQ